jgi:hypothetical protein
MRIAQDNAITRHVGSGRPNKYNFYTLEPGGMMTIQVPKDENVKFTAIKVSTALTNWKRRNGADWHSAVRNDGKEVQVYRFN